MLLVDHEIRTYSLTGFTDNGFLDMGQTLSMISPFSEGVQGNSVVSYGLSHAGYDLRLGDKILIFKNTWNQTVDPKMFKSDEYRKKVFDEVVCNSSGAFCIPPHSYALGNSLEYLRIPRWLKGRCVGKSTYARCGILINTTPLEPGWHGHLTIEISNISPCPAYVYAKEGIAQVEFEMLSGEVEQSYESKGGKYQGQGNEPIPARVKE